MDLDVIRDTLDRRQSLTLFQVLRDESDESRRSEIADVLAWLDDPRLMRPLADVMIDRSNPDALRHAASQILRDMTNSPEPDHDDIENLWNSGDLILQRHALGFMTWRHEIMFGPVLDDPQHPLYPALLSGLDFAFPFPRFSEALVTALGDPRADVRYLAAEILVWNQPAIALEPLIDTLDDPDFDVQARVIETLQYYPSAQVRDALQKLVGHDTLGDVATAALTFNRGMSGLTEENSETEIKTDEASTRTSDKSHLGDTTGRPDWLRSATAFKRKFSELDTRWEPLAATLGQINWEDVSRFARTDIADFMLTCPDVLVREHAARALTVWGDKRVRTLLEDSYFVVSKAAGYAARDLKPSKELADQLWIMLKSASGMHAVELLESFVIISESSEWLTKCAAIAQDRYWEEDVRNAAIQNLFDDFSRTGRGKEELEAIVAQILTDPPVCGWALHVTILDRCQDLQTVRLPDLTVLNAVDHSILQTKIAGIIH